MLYIVNKLYKNLEGPTWHVGGKSPVPGSQTRDSKELRHQFIEATCEVYADCDEFDYIVERFVGIPHTKNGRMHWVGDWAKMIVANLR